jgi:heme-degrading monooxygenase HmoA
MIVRLVKLTFIEDKVKDFKEIFDNSKSSIRAFPGILHLQLWNDMQHPHVFYTYSLWESENALEKYRSSELFKTTWSHTKKLFAEKAVATSLNRTDVVH